MLPIRRRRLGGGAAFNPLSIPGLKVWLKADSLGLADGTAVQTWLDSSGNGNTASQATVGLRPVFKTGIVGNLPVVRFAQASTQWLATAAFGASLSQPNTIVLVASTTGPAGDHYVHDGLTTNNRHAFIYTAQTVSTYAGTQITAGASVGTGPHIFTCFYNGASSSVFKDGVSYISGAAGANPLDGLTVGSRFNQQAGTFLDGDLEEILIYNALLTTAQQRYLEAGLSKRTGIAVS